MSGPKGIQFEIRDNGEHERRLVAAGRKQLDSALSQLYGLQSVLDSDSSVKRMEFSTDNANSDRLQAYINQVEREIAAVRVQLASQARETAKNMVLDISPSEISFKFQRRSATRQATVLKPARAGGGSADPDPSRAVSRLKRLHAQIAVLDKSVADKVNALFNAISTDMQAGLLEGIATRLDELNAEVQHAIRADHLLRAVREKADSLMIEYADVLTQEIEQDLRSATTFADLDTVTESLKRARTAAEQLQDKIFVQETTETILTGLGYRVGQTNPGVLLASSNDWPAYGIKIDISNPGMISTDPLAAGETAASDDIAFEKSSCQDILALVKQLNEKGIHTRMRSFVPVGTQPIQHIQGSSRQREHRKEKEKSL